MNSGFFRASFAHAFFAVILIAVAAAGAVAPALGEDAVLVGAPIRVPTDQLMAAGPLPDFVQGSPTAPITIIEYASATCSHCAAFHETTWPELKSKYVDAGLAKFILREFPLDPRATAAFMLARCAGPDKRDGFVDQLFSRQKTWAFVENPVEPLRAMATAMGMSQTEFETCLKDQDLYERIDRSRELAAKAFKIDSTPTFFVDGQRLIGAAPIADFDRIIDAATK